MTFITCLISYTNCLYLITISRWIDLKWSGWSHFVENKLYIHFLLSFSQFPFGRYIFQTFNDRTNSTESFQLTDYGDTYFKLSPFLNKLSDNLLLGLDLKKFRISLKRLLIFSISIETKTVKSIKKCHVRFFCPYLSIGVNVPGKFLT